MAAFTPRCRSGSECRFLKQGTCKFLHAEEQPKFQVLNDDEEEFLGEFLDELTPPSAQLVFLDAFEDDDDVPFEDDEDGKHAALEDEDAAFEDEDAAPFVPGAY